MSFSRNEQRFDITLRKFCGELPTNIFNWQKNNPYVTYTEIVDLSSLPPLPFDSLPFTDSDGYYCIKRGGENFLKHYMKPGMTLKETMLECVEFFLFHDGGLTTYDDEEYVLESTNQKVEELLSAYQHMRSEYDEEDTDDEDEDCGCNDCEDDCECECHEEECDCEDNCDCDCECHDDDDSDYVPDSDEEDDEDSDDEDSDDEDSDDEDSDDEEDDEEDEDSENDDDMDEDEY
jgi:hypothetical protein